jgi:hypothetical protein
VPECFLELILASHGYSYRAAKESADRRHMRVT